MATFLDVTLLENFGVLFVVLLIFLILFGLLEYIKAFGKDKKGLHAIIALVVALLFLVSKTASSMVQLMVPWFMVIVIFLFFTMFLIRMFGRTEADMKKLIGHKDVYPWIIVFAALIVYAFYFKGLDLALEMFIYWFLINGTFSAIGTAIARGHPLSIATAFVAAPITSLNPAIAAGWVAGYVEAKLRTPVIKDFKRLSQIDSLRDFWNNRVIRLLMVVALANVGSMIGTLIAFPYITSLLTG